MASSARSIVGAIIGTIAALCLLGLPARGAASAVPSLQFQGIARTGLPLGDITWTGAQFVYALEGHPPLYTSDARGKHFAAFDSVPRNGGEMRCVTSFGGHGWPAGTIYCHAAEGPIYRLATSGGAVSLFATIPTPRPSDGALAFDTVGRFGYALLAATGGSDSGPGGNVFAVTPDGKVRRVGGYAGPGGAEQIGVAPAGFGSAAGQLLVSIDKHDHLGRLLAMDARGSVRTLLGGLAWGLNPIAPLVTTNLPAGAAEGLYVVDWESHDILFAPGGNLRPYLGDLFVATERHGFMYVVQPGGHGYVAVPIRTNLHASNYNLEGAQFLGG
jgi:hypothetical protein